MNGDNLVIGKTNNGETLTKLAVATTRDGGFEVETTLGDSIVGVTTGGEAGAEASAAVHGINHEKKQFGYFAVGVLGEAYTGAAGVRGRSSSGVGCWGDSDKSIGVNGVSEGGSGVSGFSQEGVGVQGYAQKLWGVQGTSVGKYGTGVVGIGRATAGGVYGQSDTGWAVVGHSSSGTGVFGTSTSVDENGAPVSTGVGVRGDSPTGIGIYGASFSGLAGQFEGAVIVHGNFTVVGGVKSAAVRHPDGSHRLLYAVESPESWFEDFGTAKLKKGKAEVKLDTEFVKLVARGADYHVFLTPRGDSQGVYVSRQKPGSFEVTEQQGGKSSIPFSYRVVAKRKDIRGTRLQKVAVPKRLAGDKIVALMRKRQWTAPTLVDPLPRPKRAPRK